MSTLQRSQLDASQLLERMRLLEARLGSIAAAPLSPFSQAELLQRVADLEGRATAAESAAQLLKFSVDEVRPATAAAGAGLHQHAPVSQQDITAAG